MTQEKKPSKLAKDEKLETPESVNKPENSAIPPIKRRRGRPPKVLSEEKRPSSIHLDSHKPEVLSAGNAWDALEHPERYISPPKMQGFASQEAEVLRSDAPREQLNVRVRSELKRAVQIMAAAQNISLGDVIEEALVDYINKNNESVLGKR